MKKDKEKIKRFVDAQSASLNRTGPLGLQQTHVAVERILTELRMSKDVLGLNPEDVEKAGKMLRTASSVPDLLTGLAKLAQEWLSAAESG